MGGKSDLPLRPYASRFLSQGEDDALNPNGVGKMALMGVKEGSLYEKQHPTAINTDNFPNFKWGTWKVRLGSYALAMSMTYEACASPTANMSVQE